MRFSFSADVCLRRDAGAAFVPSSDLAAQDKDFVVEPGFCPVGFVFSAPLSSAVIAEVAVSFGG